MTGLIHSLRLEGVRLMVWQLLRSALFQKYVMLISAVMGVTLLASSVVDLWFTARDHRAVLVRVQSEQASAAASRISQFLKEIEGQLGWMTHLSWETGSAEQRELDTLRLLRQVPAISQVMLLDGNGRERLRVSRQAMDRVDSQVDLSTDPRFTGAIANKVFYGPVEFRRGTEPVMTLSLSGTRREAGVIVADVNLTHIWDVIHTIRVGQSGRAYVVGPEGRLLAHPDISLVLRNTDMSNLLQVQAARTASTHRDTEKAIVARNVQGERVLTAYAIADPPGWFVFVELPEAEANEPLYATITRSFLLTLAGVGVALLAALVLAHRMVVPIQALSAGATRIGAGKLDHRIAIATGDELQVLGGQFNEMAARLQISYSTLERTVDERTRELQLANLSKSRFLAAASHDLRQPLHALNLLVAHLDNEPDPAERARIAARIGTAVANMNDLFNALLDISKLDAGALAPAISNFAIAGLLDRIRATFGPAAREKGLHFAVVSSTRWTRSDPILLERILLNLVSNAVRYTSQGGIVVGCRHIGARLRVDVCDTGVGIPADRHRAIFAEFYRGRPHSAPGEGLGLGLAIVDRLSSMLELPIEVASTPGKGSRFSVLLSDVLPNAPDLQPRTLPPISHDDLPGKRIVVIDDDALVLTGTTGLLRNWGCEVVAAHSEQEAIESLGLTAPDLIISDYQLPEGTGIEAIDALRRMFGTPIPAFIVSGDLALSLDAEVRASGLKLVHKPLSPMVLRAMIEHLIKSEAQAANAQIKVPALVAPS